MSKVLQVDCSTGGGDIKKNFGTNYSEAWVYVDVALDATALADLLSNPASFTNFDIVQLQAQTFEYSGMEWYVDSGPIVKWAAYNNGPGDPASTPFTPSPAITSMQFYRVKMHVVAGTPITHEVWIDGASIGSIDVTSSHQPNLRILDLFQPGLTDAGFMYFDNVKVGTTDGATDIFSDDFEGGDLSNWTSADAVFSVVDDPGINPAGAAPPPPPPAPLTIKIYDLGATELADVSGIALTRSFTRLVNAPTSFTITAPANSSLLTSIAGDGFPNLYDGGNRKLVVWENTDPATTDPIFHGRIFTVERSGDANSAQVRITGYDPRMELGYEADNRAGRIVRDNSATTFGDPSFLTPVFSPTPSQDGISGPDLIKQILTYSQGDPSTNPVQGEGPLPIALTGTFDLDVPPAIDLNPVDSADWPVLVGDFINQLIATDAVDFDLRPVRPGTGLNLAGDPDDYIMAEASSMSKMGTDRSATVHFDYLTGSHNAKAARQECDFSLHCDRIWYELGPRLDKRHWRGDITPHSAIPVSEGLLTLMDDSADKYGGPGTLKGYNASIRIFDSLGNENSSRPLYQALYEAEVRWRVEPRRLLYFTPNPDAKALFQPPQDYDVYDTVQIKTGPGFGVELDEVQRIHGYTKTWTREGVAQVSELLTSADAA